MTEKQFDRDMEIWLSKPENQEIIVDVAIWHMRKRLLDMLIAKDIGP